MSIYVDGNKTAWEPHLNNGISYINFNEVCIPVKDFFESGGFEVEWDNEERSVIITSENFSKPRDIQSRLNKLGLRDVKELQNIFGLSVDGIVGKNTLKLLDRLEDIDNFKLDEFRCNHCNRLKLDIRLLELLERIRRETGPLAINSGYRCPVHNKNVGGAKRSQHLKGTAADIRPLREGTTVNDVYDVANRINSNGGVGKYRTFTHVDTRGYRSRWSG